MDAILASFSPTLFTGRHVLVSGGSSGIGLAIARGFAGLGAEVTATGSNAAKLEAGRSDPGNAGIRFASLDVRDNAAVQDFIGALPALDIVVNAAGIARPDTEFTHAGFMEVIDVNLTSMMRVASAAYPLLKARGGGAIVNIASMLSYLADAEVPAYGASKAGVLGLTRALAHAWGRDGIRVNAVSPGYHKTDMTQPLWSVPHSRDLIAARTAFRSWGRPEDLVGPVLFLASPASGFVTGADLPVDGGFVTGVQTGPVTFPEFADDGLTAAVVALNEV